ncbi:MAG: 5-formyltetrahydrofolate cyclo-ligase [Bacteroidales bacterium]|nr:5-formyltetrahydrofolate cyclo-ligase [Bacteroidales bacterium]MBO7651989.1 5-formyltetrahydrofolate cyclo-ligase [Bacteroidales bacterium]
MDKKELRKHIKALKKQHTAEQLEAQSNAIMQKLEKHSDFAKAKIVMLYYSLPDEVQTAEFIAKWRSIKQIILPTVVGDDIVPVKLDDSTTFAKGDFNIQEPQSEPYTGGYDLIVVPGVAFDRNGNRLGRGRGYYDRFLCNHANVKKIGICFDFQLVDEIPTEPTDIKMDEIISL